ncbi:MAG: enoyl-CoA hydratase/isomerase family protein [Gammaproteobacteria bacterium]|nr:enoyl-CoA hydratase/isomerase family protein [Gammaproteobacteria bacterium]
MSNLTVEKRALDLTIAIDRPESSNALSLALIKELLEVLSEYEDNHEIKSVVITGTGNKCFAAGGDIKELYEVRSEKAIENMIAVGRRTIDKIRYYPVPVLALMNGHALGGGAELAIACDYRVAVERATFGFVHSTLNITTAWGGIIDLIDIVGNRKALLTLIEGKALTTSEAYKIGILDSVCPNVEDATRDIKNIQKRINNCSSSIIRANKLIINEHKRTIHKGLKEFENREFKRSWSSEEHWESMNKLFSKSSS